MFFLLLQSKRHEGFAYKSYAPDVNCMDTKHSEGQTKFKSGPRACSACSVPVTKSAPARQEEHAEEKKKRNEVKWRCVKNAGKV